MPLLFVISGRWKDLLILSKKRCAIAADQRDAARASASRGSDGCRRVAAQVCATACAELASPRVKEELTYLGQRFAHRALPKP